MDYVIGRIVVGDLETNCYILTDTKSKQCAVIDPGAEYKKIKNYIEANKLNPLFIINTHGHPDHILANTEFILPVHIHKDDAEYLLHPDKLLNDKDIINIGNLNVKVIHTPGHTPGSICLLYNGVVFSGDTLFCGGIGRTDLPGGSEEDIIDSIKNKLFRLPEDTKVYPGHGPQTTIAREKTNQAL